MPKFTPPCTYIRNIATYTQQEVWGHVRSMRTQGTLGFLTVYDGTSAHPLQCIINFQTHPNLAKLPLHAGAFVKVRGLVVPSPAKGQVVELQVDMLDVVGPVIDTDAYLPLVKGVSLDTLRGSNAYLRPKFQTFLAVYTIRDRALQFIEEFLRSHGFKHLDPNILTASDCEGAGEMFTVAASIPEFFGANKRVGLTVSSQLQLEALTPVGAGVYTLNKSFRAEKSNTSRHLAEFTHLEWESKIVDTLTRLMDFNEDLITTVLQRTLEECKGELATLNSFVSKGILARLESWVKSDFARISYTEAIALLQRDVALLPEGVPRWGDDLGSRNERHLAEAVFGKPVFVYDYPRDLKSFYMKQNAPDAEGRITVQGCDLLMPFMGELVGSSVREENANVLLEEMGRRGMDPTSLGWYIDLRRNGGCRTSGAGIGFERLLQILCFMESNIRDVTPFPIANGECEY